MTNRWPDLSEETALRQRSVTVNHVSRKVRHSLLGKKKKCDDLEKKKNCATDDRHPPIFFFAHGARVTHSYTSTRPLTHTPKLHSLPLSLRRQDPGTPPSSLLSQRKKKTPHPLQKNQRMRSPTTYPTAKTLAGQRRQVYNGTAMMTRGGLKKKDLTISASSGKIVSLRASQNAKRSFKKNGLSAYSYPRSPKRSRTSRY